MRRNTVWLRRRKIALVLVAICAALTLQLASQFVERPVANAHAALSGSARVMDGDSIELAGTHVRLEGIDAPETRQTCRTRHGAHWNCGQAATRALQRLISGREVQCEHRGIDAYGRVLGRCFVGSTELNAEMVQQGLAWAFTRYSNAYVTHEKRARERHFGIWQGDAQPAWAYRAAR